MKRFPLVLLVWLGCAFAWMLLGTSLVVRTGGMAGEIGKEVRLLWGPELVQGHPSAEFGETRRVVETVTEQPGRSGEPVVTRVRDVIETRPVPLVGSDLQVKLDLTHRRKGLLWFPTYASDFAGRFTFQNPVDSVKNVTFVFPLGDASNVYDGFAVTGENGEAVATQVGGRRATWTATLQPGERRAWSVRYRSRGTSRWTYQPTDGAGRVEDFTLAMTTNFPNVDFAPGSISPSRHASAARSWTGTWRFDNLVASSPISLVLPEKLNPGPIASRITFFAPVGLLFFFFVVAILSTARGFAIHPMNYFFFGCGFFAFHLLFAYLVDHLAIVPSFAIASLVSVFLIVSYARLFTGARFAFRTIGAAQLIYLVLFSATFFWQGFTGLAITVGAVLTLFVMMQVTGRVEWGRASQAPSHARTSGRVAGRRTPPIRPNFRDSGRSAGGMNLSIGGREPFPAVLPSPIQRPSCVRSGVPSRGLAWPRSRF